MRRAFTVLVGVAVAVAIMPSAGAATVHLPRTSIHVISASPVPSVRRSPAGTVNESARSTDHELRCRATFPSRELEPGLETGARMSVINTTDHAIKISVGFLDSSLIFRDASGNQLLDTGYFPFPGPAPYPEKLRAGEREKLSVRDAVVRWDGPISIEPVCSVGHKVTMAPITFGVDGALARPTDPEAVSLALHQTGGLFRSCRPNARGDRTIGTIAPPIGKGPAMTAKCWAKVVQHDGFDVVDLNFLSPSDLHAKALPVGPAFGQLPGNKRTVEEARYGFVVSVRGTVPYDSLEQSRTRTGDRRVYGYFLQHGKWHVDGYGHCGGGALGWGRGIFFEDIAGCPE